MSDDDESFEYLCWKHDTLVKWREFRQRKHHPHNWKIERASLLTRHDLETCALKAEMQRKQVEAYQRGRDFEAQNIFASELHTIKANVLQEIRAKLERSALTLTDVIQRDARKLLDTIYGTQYLQAEDIQKDVKKVLDAVYANNAVSSDVHVTVTREVHGVGIRASLQLMPQSITTYAFFPYLSKKSK